ncbi:MAG: glycoside hydrolase domain-containing protein, partial [Thermoguttaceae bacterium]
MNRRSSNSCPMRRQTAATLAALPIALAVLLSGPGTTAAQAANAPAGVQVRPASAVQKVSTEGLPLPGVQNGTLELAAPRNGVASAQAIVTAAEEFAGPPCRITDLRSADGGTIPAGKVQIRYADPAPQYVPLHEEPLSGRKVHPVFVTVKVPAEAKAGRYKGTLTLPWADKQIDVPVALTVHAWKIPDPGQWRTCVSLLQSPEAVAGFYNVPLWSDRHFALMEKSFEIMGQTGNKVLGVSAVSKGVFGDDPIIVFRREGGNLVPDFTHLERYLSLYIKHAGPPQFLAVNVWNYTMYNKDFGRGGGGTRDDEKAKVTVAELQGGQLGYGEAPMYGWPGAEKFWQPVMDGICQVVKKAGLRENAILLGTSGDMWPSRSTVEFFKKIAPYAEWRTLTHGQGAPKWGYTQSGRLQPNGMIVGYYDAARLLPNNRIRVLGHPVTCNARDHVGSGPGTFRGLVAILDF